MFEVLDPIAAQLGFSGGEFRFVLCLLLAYPASLCHRALPTGGHNSLKHIVSFVLGFAEAFLCFEWDAFHALAATLVTYALMLCFRRHCGWLAFAFNLLHLTWGNYDRLVNDYLGYSLNWTVPQMIMCCKLSALAWNYADGAYTEAQLAQEARGRDDVRASHRLVELPSLLAVLGYAFFFAGWLTGPWGDFAEYQRFTDRSLFKDTGGQIPSAAKFLLSRVLLIIPAFVGNSLASTYPVMMMVQDDFLLYPLWKRMALYLLAVELFYCKYYVVWWLGEGACALSGYSYNGLDAHGTARWDRIKMVDLWKFKFGTSAQRDMVPAWNIPSHLWLKRYVHMRLPTRVFSGLSARIVTFLVSAIWHGLYPGYYVFFFFSAVFVEIGKLFGSVFLPYALMEDGKTARQPHKAAFDMFARILLLLTVDYLALPFQLMAFSYGLKALGSVYYIGHVAILFALGVFLVARCICPRRKSRPVTKSE